MCISVALLFHRNDVEPPMCRYVFLACPIVGRLAELWRHTETSLLSVLTPQLRGGAGRPRVARPVLTAPPSDPDESLYCLATPPIQIAPSRVIHSSLQRGGYVHSELLSVWSSFWETMQQQFR